MNTINNKKDPNKNGTASEEVLEPVDAEVTVTVQEKAMSAGIYITRPRNGGRRVDKQMIDAALSEHGIVFGLQEDKIKTLASKPIYNVTIMIANGKYTIPGKDATIEFLINREVSSRPKEREDGTVDYRELGIVQQVKEGQVLATRIPPTPGVDGSDVLGNVLPSYFGRDYALPSGKNTIVSEDGLQLLAQKTGHVEFSGGKIHVHDTYSVREDVSSATGNITFDGSVTVRGSVLAGFVVDATGDVNIRGSCEAATIKSGGKVTIGEGVNGGTIRAEGDLKSKYLQNCEVEVGGNIYTDSIINCDIHCGDSLLVLGGRGAILGGRCSAAKLIECAYIGSNSTHVPTRVEVGQDLRVQVRLREAPAERDAAANFIASLENMIGMLSQLEAVGRLDAERMEYLQKARFTYEVQKNLHATLVQEIEDLHKKAAELTSGAVIAKGGIAPGVHLTVCSLQMAIKDFKPNTKAIKGDGGILLTLAV